MFTVFIRALILYIVVLIVMRFMGKRQIGQLQPFEVVITIMIAELAAVPMGNTGIPIMHGIIPIATLLVAQIAFSYVTLKSERARGFICGKPTILIENGKIKENELRNQLYNINDLVEQLRIKNIPNIADVEFAILETNGDLSVIPKSQKRPIITEDLNLQTMYEGLAVNLVMDGQILGQNLHKIGLDEEWLQNEIIKLGVDDVNELLYACIDTSGNIFFQRKEDNT